MSAFTSISASTIPAFYLFKSPLVVHPPFELFRTLSNLLFRTYYRYGIEPEFTDESFIKGVKLGVCNCANSIRLQEYEKLTTISTTDTVKRLRRRIADLPQSALDEHLSFKMEDIDRVSIYSYLVSTDKFLGITDIHRITFYVTAVVLINRFGNQPSSWKSKRNVEDKLICNITFGRILYPLGRWRVTDVNFFDGQVLKYI
ncbi:hypothetical protein M3Y94_00819900 [Aphelenchoides besseyi]|nr:hypothetical protein M3Y94_00819900 [Aphelenchoides besseyi]KAI6227126.1 hypothetical protein M3Y95_00693700 [Aphelenchoides besseyi]